MTNDTPGAAALLEAARWRLAALLLERPRPGWTDEVATLAAEVGDETLGAVAALAADAREGDYLALLGPGGAVPAREVGYRPREDPGWILADLARFFDAFAYRPRAEDPADHVAVEAGFVGYLHLKEALAQAAGEDDAAAVAREARAAFLATHLAPMIGRLAHALQLAGDDSHIGAAAAAIAAQVPDAPIGPVGTDDLGDCDGCTLR